MVMSIMVIGFVFIVGVKDMTIEVMTMQTMVMRVLVVGNMTIEVMSMLSMVIGPGLCLSWG